MILERLAVRKPSGEAVGAMDGLRRKGGGAIERDQQRITKHATGSEHAVLLKALEELHKHRIEVAWRERSEQGADLIVTGNVLNATQGLGVIVPFRVLQPVLVLSKRRRLGEEETTGASDGVLDRVTRVGAWFAMVRQGIDALA